MPLSRDAAPHPPPPDAFRTPPPTLSSSVPLMHSQPTTASHKACIPHPPSPPAAPPPTSSPSTTPPLLTPRTQFRSGDAIAVRFLDPHHPTPNRLDTFTGICIATRKMSCYGNVHYPRNAPLSLPCIFLTRSCRLFFQGLPSPCATTLTATQSSSSSPSGLP